ncbi:hypothetical protein AVEN_59080-1 [Araneus ventricosus]|uniref:Uncharacterized protein n=1 Tax=Araneus ventricosus TaxID=182803 RepID=A0A4Y2RGY9_ARAVE|nr:hypothetical protein AVEN_59080-1 [Araneus ventricosus]
MSLIHVAYQTIQQLVEAFQALDPVKLPHPEKPNFVLVDPRHYYGSYGGLVYDSILDRYSQMSLKIPFIASPIGHGLSVVWWSSPEPPFTGDVHALSVQDRVGVTPDVYNQMHRHVIRKKVPPASRYYGKNAWCM